ncbi:MAG: homocysteine S-methyltransferase family protein [Christensenella sp.]|uniref:homocysteine S-methyltransferase family protein n=1 Tax=Christensenella sp. TaxID=1935934 RepID=UPI002B1EC6CA|nr:homocysteine S-methyltransferase family protein [Christensenella sp.]MEA5002856.1 homocysteine S-methyltransferase family protein [Christensenella sp.]
MGKLAEKCKNGVLLYDGSKGVMLQRRGLTGGQSAEEWNLTQADKVRDVYMSYIDAGADVIQTNTFCGNGPQLKAHGLSEKLYEINYEGAKLALACTEGKDVMVAASIGPTGLFFEPAGEMKFETAVEYFKQQLMPLKDAGVGIVNFETFTDLNEMRAGVVAAQELGGFEIITHMTYENGSTMSGNTPDVCASVLYALGATLVGANCSGGPDSLLGPLKVMGQVAPMLCAKPNAGLPEMESGVAVFKQRPEDFAASAQDFLDCGVRLLGGCCGSSEQHIAALREAIDAARIPAILTPKQQRLASTYSSVVWDAGLGVAEMDVCTDAVLSGIRGGDYFCLMDAVPAGEADADVVAVDFRAMEMDFDMWSFVSTLSMFVKKPLIVKAENTELVKAFLRCYAGRAGVTDKEAAAYGALLV